MRCDKCGWYRPKHAVCEFDDTLTEPYESCLNWKPITNADRLNAMTVEEKAKWIAHIAGCPLNVFEESPLGRCTTNCKARDCWLGWLKQEVTAEG